MDTKKHYKLYKDGKKWCVMTIAAVASVIGLATTANADETNTTTSPVQTTQVADNSNVTETTESNANSNGLNQTVNNSNDTVVNNTENTTQLETMYDFSGLTLLIKCWDIYGPAMYFLWEKL